MGQPSKLTKENKSKLEKMAQLDASIPEMAYYCGVHKQTVYNWKKENPKYFDYLDTLREKPVLKARETVIKHSTKNYQNAMDYLKRKRRTEFGDQANTVVITPTPLLEALHVKHKEISDKKHLPEKKAELPEANTETSETEIQEEINKKAEA